MHSDSTPDYPLCACGCGRPVVRRDGRKQRFLRGHSGTNVLIDATCAHCSAAFRTNRWRVDGFANVFCSRACCAESRLNQITIVCILCGKERTDKAHRAALKRTPVCAQCLGAWKSMNRVGPNIPVRCDQCGAAFLVFPSKAKINRRHYCSVECRAQHIIGPNNPSYTSGKGRKVQYGFNWKRQRSAALRRDGHRCQHCGKQPGKPRYLHVHHVIPAHRFNGDYEAANVLSNLLTLCLPCHKAAESGRIAVQAKLL